MSELAFFIVVMFMFSSYLTLSEADNLCSVLSIKTILPYFISLENIVILFPDNSDLTINGCRYRDLTWQVETLTLHNINNIFLSN